MKKIAFICLLLASLCARADIVIVEDVQTDAGNQEITVKIKGDKIRTDVGKEITAIIDLNSGDVLTIMHAQKMFIKMAGKMKAVLEQVKKAQATAAASGTAPKITDTGKQEKVGDYNAEIYTVESDYGKTTMWVTKDFPNYAAIKEEMKKLDSLQAISGKTETDTSKVDGVPVKIEAVVGGKTITTKMVSIKQDQVNDAEFQTPADYKEMQMPKMPAGAEGGGDGGAAPGGQ